MSRTLSTLVCTALALFTLLATACQPNLENNAEFQDKVAFINRLDEQMKDLDQRVDRNGSFLKQIADNIKKLNAESHGGSNDAVAALEQRVQRLENSLKTANDTIVAMETRLKEATEAQNKLAGAIKTSQSQSAKSVALKPAKSSTTATATASKKEAQPKATGKYHLVKAGETIDSIARENKIAPVTLMTANRLPKGTKLMAGQRVFVPSATN